MTSVLMMVMLMMLMTTNPNHLSPPSSWTCGDIPRGEVPMW
jgi:hypothetical protein